MTKTVGIFIIGVLVSYLAGAYLNDGAAAIAVSICFFGSLIFSALEKLSLVLSTGNKPESEEHSENPEHDSKEED